MQGELDRAKTKIARLEDKIFTPIPADPNDTHLMATGKRFKKIHVP
jgi:hypothetical protein